MSKTAKIVLSVTGLLVLVGGIIAGLVLVRQRQEIRKKAAPATTLSLSPPTQSKSPGETFNFSVRMNTGENQVTGIDVDLNFDPSALEILSIQRGFGISSFTQEIRNTIDNTSGRVAYTAFTLDKTQAVSGTDVDVLNASARVKPGSAVGSYTVSFAATTAVAGVAEGQNVLISTTQATVSVLAAAPSPTPVYLTPTPTPVGGPQPSPTPVTATATPTPTLTPTSAAQVTASPTPISELPDTGISAPALLGISLGLLLLIASAILAF